jgi:hypothetical protein
MAKKRNKKPEPRMVRKSLLVDADQLEQARKFLNARSDAEVLRLALEHLLSHFEDGSLVVEEE